MEPPHPPAVSPAVSPGGRPLDPPSAGVDRADVDSDDPGDSADAGDAASAVLPPAEPPASFTNEPIDVAGLPRLDDEPFAPLDPTYARVRAASAGLSIVVVVIVALVGAAALSSPIPLVVGGLAVVFVAIVGVVQRLETNHMGYLVRDHDVSFCSGIIGRSVATVPFARVQHVSIERGPVDRWFDLAALQLRTAGGHIAIPGLRRDVAERLKELVSSRAGALAEAEADDPPTGDA